MWFQRPWETLLAWELCLERKLGSSLCHGIDRFTHNVTRTRGTLRIGRTHGPWSHLQYIVTFSPLARKMEYCQRSYWKAWNRPSLGQFEPRHMANWGRPRLAYEMYPGVQSPPQKWAFAEPRPVNQSPSQSTNTKMPKGRSYTHTTQFTWNPKRKAVNHSLATGGPRPDGGTEVQSRVRLVGWPVQALTGIPIRNDWIIHLWWPHEGLQPAGAVLEFLGEDEVTCL